MTVNIVMTDSLVTLRKQFQPLTGKKKPWGFAVLAHEDTQDTHATNCTGSAMDMFHQATKTSRHFQESKCHQIIFLLGMLLGFFGCIHNSIALSCTQGWHLSPVWIVHMRFVVLASERTAKQSETKRSALQSALHGGATGNDMSCFYRRVSWEPFKLKAWPVQQEPGRGSNKNKEEMSAIYKA